MGRGTLKRQYICEKGVFFLNYVQGASPSERPFLWKVILGYYLPQSTAAERAQLDQERL